MAITKAKQIKKNDIKKAKQAKKVATTTTKKPQRLKVHDGADFYCSVCGEWGLLSSSTWTSHCHHFSHTAWSLGERASVIAALRLQSTDSVVVVHRLNCFVACGIFLGQGLNLFVTPWTVVYQAPLSMGFSRQ